MQITINGNKDKDGKSPFIFKEPDGSCTILYENKEREGWIVSLNSKGEYVIELIEEETNED